VNPVVGRRLRRSALADDALSVIEAIERFVG
jgi:hypothetical protein